MTPIEQHLEDYEMKLTTLICALVRGGDINAIEKKLKTARKQLADHITLCQTAHHHSQYELKTHGLP